MPLGFIGVKNPFWGFYYFGGFRTSPSIIAGVVVCSAGGGGQAGEARKGCERDEGARARREEAERGRRTPPGGFIQGVMDIFAKCWLLIGQFSDWSIWKRLGHIGSRPVTPGLWRRLSLPWDESGNRRPHTEPRPLGRDPYLQV